MRYRVAFLCGVAAGFVLGTRAGRERYEQMKRIAHRAADSPAVQQAAGALQAQAADLAKTARQKVTDGLQEQVPKIAGAARSKATERIPGLRHRNGHTASGDGTGDYPRAATRSDTPRHPD